MPVRQSHLRPHAVATKNIFGMIGDNGDRSGYEIGMFSTSSVTTYIARLGITKICRELLQS